MSYEIVKEADDPLALRVSIGSPNNLGYTIKNDGYVVYRGDARACLQLIRQAADELEKQIDAEETGA